MASSKDCAGCLNTLNDTPTLQCSRCNAKYHYYCMNLTQPDYVAMSDETLSNWICVLCRSKERKGGDNTNTPVRAPIYSPQPDFVTQRSKTRNAASCSCLSADNIRDLMREELLNFFQHKINPQLSDLRSALTSIETSVSYFNEELEKVKAQTAAQAANIESIRLENESLRAANLSLSSRLAQLDQHSRSSNVEIQCVPESKQENLIKTVQQLGKIIKCPLDEAQIHVCSRLAKMNNASPRPRSILVKFSSPRLRDEFLAATSKFNKNNKDDKLNASHLGIGGSKKSPIYVVEHLTPDNKALHAAARSKARELKYKFVWIRDGRIFMRKTEESNYVYVKNLDVLNHLS